MIRRTIAFIADTVLLGCIICIAYIAFELADLRITYFYVISVVLAVLYPVAFDLLPTAGTPGLMLTGLRVNCPAGKGRIGCLIKRAFWRFVTCIPVGLGFWSGFFQKNGRTVYDIMSGTYVGFENAHSGNDDFPHIIIKGRNGRSAAYPIEFRNVTIGRNPAVCNILYPPDAAGVSRSHCMITYNSQANVFFVEDMGSSFGTFRADGIRFTPGKTYVLSPDECFYLGGFENEIKVVLTPREL